MRHRNRNVRLYGDTGDRGPFDPNIVHVAYREDWQGEHIFSVPCVNVTFGEGSVNMRPTNDLVTCVECLAEPACDS